MYNGHSNRQTNSEVGFAGWIFRFAPAPPPVNNDRSLTKQLHAKCIPLVGYIGSLVYSHTVNYSISARHIFDPDQSMAFHVTLRFSIYGHGEMKCKYVL